MTFRFQCEAVSAVLRDHEHPAKLDIRDTGAGWREKRKKSDSISERPADLSLLAPSDADKHKLSEKECKRSKIALEGKEQRKRLKREGTGDRWVQTRGGMMHQDSTEGIEIRRRYTVCSV